MPPSYTTRQARLSEVMQTAGLDAIALNPGSSLVYLTGLHFHLMERPVVVIFSRESSPVIILPTLETAKLEAPPYPVRAFTYGDNPADWGAVFRQAVQSAEIGGGAVGLEQRQLRVLELRYLEAAAPEARFLPADQSLAALRVCKDGEEVAAIRKAVQIAQAGLQATLPIIKAGVAEREIAAELTLQLLRAGSQPEIPFSPIVSGGPNSANPHAVPTDRKLSPGDMLVIDWGATFDGYISDLTRTFAIGSVEPEMEQIHHLVEAANAAGRAAARPGIPAGEIDHAARKVIADAGYGQFFTHGARHRHGGSRGSLSLRGKRPDPSTGHGIHRRAGYLSAQPQRCAHRGQPRHHRDRRGMPE